MKLMPESYGTRPVLLRIDMGNGQHEACTADFLFALSGVNRLLISGFKALRCQP